MWNGNLNFRLKYVKKICVEVSGIAGIQNRNEISLAKILPLDAYLDHH